MRRRRLVSGVVLVFSWVVPVGEAVDPVSVVVVLIVAVVSVVGVVVFVCSGAEGVVVLWFMSGIEPVVLLIEPVVSVVAAVPVCWSVGELVELVAAPSVVLAVVSVAVVVVAMLLVMPVLTVPLKVLPGAVLPVRFVVSADAQPHSIAEKTATAMRDGVVRVLILSFNLPSFLVLRVAERKIAAAAATPFKTGTYTTADVATA